MEEPMATLSDDLLAEVRRAIALRIAAEDEI